jgi:uncharacterized phage protein gp47/JayE
MALAELVYIDETGYHYPDYPTCLAYYQDAYREIYGNDVYLEPDSQDGQWMAVQAQAFYDTAALGAAVYNSFSPMTASKDALSRNVRLNGIKRQVPSLSNVDLDIVGQAGTSIVDGVAINKVTNSKWMLPALVVIPVSGTITVNAVAAELGATQSAPGEIDVIGTPTRGWQTVTNPLAAVPGAPVESNAELRRRQAVSTALPSLTVLDGTIGAVANVTGVTRYAGYENDTKVTDADGIPGNSIAIVVEGGAVQDIVNAIGTKKTPGTGTFGTTDGIFYDTYGLPKEIHFFRPTIATVTTEITLKALQGYTTGYEDQIAQAVTDFYNSLKIGSDVFHSKVFTPANLPNAPEVGSTFDIQGIKLGKNAGVQAATNVVIGFTEVAFGDVSDVTFVYV